MAIQYDGSDKHVLAIKSTKTTGLPPPPPYTPGPQYSIELPGSFPDSRVTSPQEGYIHESRRELVPYQSPQQCPPLPPRSQPHNPLIQDQNEQQYGVQAQWNGQYPYSPEEYTLQYQSQQSPSPISPMTNLSYRPDQTHTSLQRLPTRSRKPCVIPQITTVFGAAHMSPFARARALELEQAYGITAREMLAFIDGLNEAFIANPVLQATSTIGNIVGFVPIPTAQIVGNSISLASGLGMAATSVMRTKQYMKKANDNIFTPKGLHVQICKTEKMLMQTEIRCDASVFAQRQYQVGEAPGVGNHLVRRMDALGDRVMGLSFDVEAPTTPDNWMKKIGAYSAQRAELNQLKKMNKKQAKRERKYAKAERKGRRRDKRAEKLQSKETKKVKELLWIVIMAERESLPGDDEWDSGNDVQTQ